MATTAKYPASLAALVDFGADTADLVTAVLSGSHNASVTTITLTATVPSQWPTAGWVTIDGEIIKYAGKSGSTLTSCTRGDQSSYGGGIASTHNDQSIVGAYLTAQQVNQIVAEVIALETYFAPGGAVATIASAGTTDLSTVAKQYIQVTGTTTITAFGTVLQGEVKILEFAGALTLTHNASSLILRSAANATTAAGDIYAFVSEGSGNWREVWHNTAAASSDTAADQQTGYWHYAYSGEQTPIDITLVGSGTVSSVSQFSTRRFDTGATSASSAAIRAVMGGTGTTMAVGKVRRLEILVDLVAIDANTTSYLFITTESVTGAPSLTADHIGIKNVAGTVSFTTADGTTEQTTNITSFVTAAKDQTYVATNDGTTVKLYIDGTLRATHATNVPRSTLNTSIVVRGYIVNSAAASKKMDLAHLEMLVAV